jgi:N4-gp56 family major capsid protein
MANKIDTNAPYGDPQNIVRQSVGLFQVNMQRSSTFGHLTGKFTQQQLKRAGDGATGRTTSSLPVVRAANFGRGKGDEITFNLVNPVGAYPIMGSAYAEGRGTALSISEDRLRINQARFPIDLGNTMTDIRSPVDFRTQGRPIAQDLINRYVDQTLLVHAAGARGFHDNIEWAVPLNTHPKFGEIVVNQVRPPTKNRHLLASGDSITKFKVNAGAVDITSADVMSMDVIDALRAYLDELPLPPNPIKLDGDPVADESPLRLLLVSPSQYNLFARDPAFRQWVAASHSRASLLKQHPLFLGEVGLWNNILIRKLPRPIRFYAGDPIQYLASDDSEAESTATVPAAFAGSFAIDRAILLGGSAIAEGLGGKADGAAKGLPFFWSEKKLDHDDKTELLVGAVRGVSKVRFKVDEGDKTVFTDHGILTLDTVVPLIA